MTLLWTPVFWLNYVFSPVLSLVDIGVQRKLNMPRNVEIKAVVLDINKIKQLAYQLSQSDGRLIEQEDTFFNAPNGRLKLRELKVIY